MFKLGQEITSDQAMRFSIETAKLGRGFVSPNPLVGCVIVDSQHKFLASGAHLRFGGEHAEINALKNLQDKSKLNGARVYVTLEPCAHQGKTGSCAKALSQYPIKEVYYGLKDPNPLVAGQGLEILIKNGIDTYPFGKYEEECQEVCEQFLYHIAHQKPFISMKVGTSLDGKIALTNGESQWITGEEARKHARNLRAHYDATLIGAGTFMFDDPLLDFRGTGYEHEKKNKVIILDPKGKAASSFKDSKINKKHGPKNVFVLTPSDHSEAWSKNLVHVINWDSSKDSWNQALKNLYNKGIASVFVEGGSFVFGQLLEHQMVQKLYLYQAPKVLGAGKSWSDFLKLESLSQAKAFKKWKTVPLGEDRLNILYF